MDVMPLFDRELVLDLSAKSAKAAGLIVDVVLDRCVVHSRAEYTLRTIERWGVPTLNHSAATTTCDDKAACSLALEAANIATPRTLLAFSVDSALKACEQIGYPVVLKPVTGSWGRLLAKANGPEQARAIPRPKGGAGRVPSSCLLRPGVHPKPDRDIRAYVVGDRVLAASYRTSEHWITNAARGAVSVTCEITPEIEEIALRACQAVGRDSPGSTLSKRRTDWRSSKSTPAASSRG